MRSRRGCAWGAFDQLALRALPRVRLGPLSGADLVSAAAFSLARLQHHRFHLTPAAALQLANTFPIGLCLGWLRGETKSLAAPILVHLASNPIAQLV